MLETGVFGDGVRHGFFVRKARDIHRDLAQPVELLVLHQLAEAVGFGALHAAVVHKALGDGAHLAVGDQIVVRILSVKRDNVEDLSIKADVKSVSDNNKRTNLSQCRIQSKYAGKVTDVHKGVVYVRLTNGVNAVAHSCYDRRMPGKKDDVSFAVTHIDEEKGVAVGIITRIIKQNL